MAIIVLVGSLEEAGWLLYDQNSGLDRCLVLSSVAVLMFLEGHNTFSTLNENLLKTMIYSSTLEKNIFSDILFNNQSVHWQNKRHLLTYQKRFAKYVY